MNAQSNSIKSLRLCALAAGLLLAAAGAQAQSKPAGKSAAAPSAPSAPAASAPSPQDVEMAKAGQLAAHAWLLLLDRKDWGTAWDTSAAMFRKNVPLPAWMDQVPQVRAPFGAFVERQPVEVVYKKSLPGQPAGDYVTALFITKFEKKDEVQETVTTVREPDGRWRVTGYAAR